MYVIRKISSDLLFYVDRSKTRRFWWTYNLKYAFVFKNKEAAEKKMNSLKYGKFKVITLDEAKTLRRYKDLEHELSRPFTPSDYANSGWADNDQWGDCEFGIHD